MRDTSERSVRLKALPAVIGGFFYWIIAAGGAGILARSSAQGHDVGWINLVSLVMILVCLLSAREWSLLRRVVFILMSFLGSAIVSVPIAFTVGVLLLYADRPQLVDRGVALLSYIPFIVYGMRHSYLFSTSGDGGPYAQTTSRPTLPGACRHCKMTISAGARFCAACGAATATVQVSGSDSTWRTWRPDKFTWVIAAIVGMALLARSGVIPLRRGVDSVMTRITGSSEARRRPTASGGERRAQSMMKLRGFAQEWNATSSRLIDDYFDADVSAEQWLRAADVALPRLSEIEASMMRLSGDFSERRVRELIEHALDAYGNERNALQAIARGVREGSEDMQEDGRRQLQRALREKQALSGVGDQE